MFLAPLAEVNRQHTLSNWRKKTTSKMSTSGCKHVLELLRSVGPDDGAPSTEHSSEFDLHREAQTVPETEMPPSPCLWCDVCAAASRLTSKRSPTLRVPLALAAMAQRTYVTPSMYPNPFFDDNSLDATGIAEYSLWYLRVRSACFHRAKLQSPY